MSINFQINKNKIKNPTIEEDSDKNKCVFSFTSSEWEFLDKYVIFWNEENKTTVKNIGKGSICECLIPDSFKKIIAVQIYADHNNITDKFNTLIVIEKHKKKFHFNNNYKRICYNIHEDNGGHNQDGIYVDKETESEKSIIVDSELSFDSENPVQNKVVALALSRKINSNEISDVGKSGEYSDLLNTEHTHKKEDISDFDDGVDVRIELALMDITDDIMEM